KGKTVWIAHAPGTAHTVSYTRFRRRQPDLTGLFWGACCQVAGTSAPSLPWKVVTGCRERIQHWQQVEDDYGALQERLGTLPDKLSYSIMVPFGPFAFMPGKLVHTNEVTVLLGDNWFAKCSAKQAVGLVEHRKGHVRKTIDDLKKVMTNFESRVEFTEDLQKMSDAAGDIVDIREEIKSDFKFKAKHRIAHKPHSKPKTSNSFEADFANVESKDLLADQELWARLEELERQEELLGELERSCSRENSVCSDTSEGSADCEERRGLLRSVSCEEAVGSDAGESILEEEQEQLPETLLPAPGTLEAFSGTVIEKELSPCLALHPATVHPVLPTIPERREVPSEGSEVTKRVSKFKAARLQQRI
ncbi:unconventional prefoldin RPB5 interactor-like, partial [Myotis lucifugus]|uniref:unconventional prefoldin RPB5 interactor-like n=1 Tax=Myotis lucifugus TaxID=59463 RepID=UPI000CCC195D